MSEQAWPDFLWIVRHGQSAGNVARDAAEAARHPRISLTTRDMDVPLSELGERQAVALGRWYSALASDEKFTTVLTSPYVRALGTAQRIVAAAQTEGIEVPIVQDERLREKEFGILDRLTHLGISASHPEQADFRKALGKFYHRPPGGESWCDVILRLRSVVDTLTREYRGERLLIVCHSVVVSCFRYLLERLTEEEIIAIDRENDIANCSVTSYRFDPTGGRGGKLQLQAFNFVAPLEDAGESVTRKPDVPIAPK